MEFHRALGHPGEEITRQTTCMAGVQLGGTWNPRVHCSEARMWRHTVPNLPTTGRTDAWEDCPWASPVSSTRSLTGAKDSSFFASAVYPEQARPFLQENERRHEGAVGFY